MIRAFISASRLVHRGSLLLAFWMASPAVADAGSPRLLRMVPPGGQRGSTVDVQLTGRYLEKPEEVLFYEPGITVEAIEYLEGQIEINGRKDRVEPGTRVQVRLKIADDCAIGPHGLRVRTANGISDYQRFFVSPFPIVDEDEQNQQRNDKPEKAKSVAVNSTVHGRMNDSADVDLYQLQFKKGDRISAEIEAARLGVERGIPDLHLSVLDGEGKSIADADDSALFVQDPVLSVLADRDGAYYVAVRHSIYNASNDVYRLHVGSFPRPTAVYPAGGQLGEKLDVRLLGDPRGERTQSVQFPSDKAGGFDLVVEEDGVAAPSRLKMRVSSFANVLESEPNDSLEQLASVSAVELPIALNGIIERPGDVDFFRFRAKKGDRFRVHAIANAVASPLDPTITIRLLTDKPGAPMRATDSRPNQLGVPPSGGLNRDTLDPMIEFNAPADGEYALSIEDDRGRGGSDFVYRIEASPENDAVYTFVPLEPENQFTPQARQTINVPAGNRYNTSISIFNAGRPFNGELELVAIGLPEGVTMCAPRITTAMPRVPVVFEATADANRKAHLIEIIARPIDSSTKIDGGFRQVVAMNAYGNNDYYLHAVLDRLPIAVTEPAPFSIEVEQPKSAPVQNGETALKFAVKRNDGFDGPVTVSMEWKPTGVTASTPITVRADKWEAEYVIGPPAMRLLVSTKSH